VRELEGGRVQGAAPISLVVVKIHTFCACSRAVKAPPLSLSPPFAHNGVIIANSANHKCCRMDAVLQLVASHGEQHRQREFVTSNYKPRIVAYRYIIEASTDVAERHAGNRIV
jgi:hypothetical protein